MVAIEVKRRGDIDGVEQLARYIERLHLDSSLGTVRGVFVAQVVKPQARVLAEARGFTVVEVDYDELRGMQTGRAPPVLTCRATRCRPSDRASARQTGLRWSGSAVSSSTTTGVIRTRSRRCSALDPDGRPWAELWFGTHPGGPATLDDGRIAVGR